MGALTGAHQIYCDVAVHLLSTVYYTVCLLSMANIKVSLTHVALRSVLAHFIDATLLAVTCRPNTK